MLKVLREGIPVTLHWNDLHPGVAEYARLKTGEEGLWQGRRNQMPLEYWRVFRYCVTSEKAAKEGTASLNELLAMHLKLDEIHGLR